MQRFERVKSQISGDFTIDHSTTIILKSIQNTYTLIMEQQNKPLNEMTLQELEERHVALLAVMKNPKNLSDEHLSLIQKERAEVLELITELRGQ